MRVTNIVTTSLLIFALATMAMGQGYVDILPDEVKNPFIEKYQAVSKQVSQQPTNEWAGIYVREIGPTWSEALVWDPRIGFAAFRDTCSNGPRAWVNHGDASFSEGTLTFSPERKKGDEFVLELPASQFTPIKWGEQHWLVPSNQLVLFAYAVNSRSGDPYTIAYLKSDDSEKRQTKFPDLPPQYKRHLGLASIRTKVVELSEGAELWGSSMTIDAGKNKGVIEGMSFWLVGQRDIHVTLTVVEVRERTSIVEVTEWGSGPSGRKPVPAVGWRFTSRYPFN